MAQLSASAGSSSTHTPPDSLSKRRRIDTVLQQLTLGPSDDQVTCATSIAAGWPSAAQPAAMFSRGDSEQERPAEEGEPPAAALGAVPREPLMRSPRALGADVFRFDSSDGERFACCAISEEEEDVFSPVSSKSPHSSLDSPLVSQDSPRVGLGAYRIKEEPDLDSDSRLEGGRAVCSPPRLQVLTCDRPAVCAASTASGAHKFTFCACAQCTAGMESEHRLEVHSRLLGAGLSSSPISPLTPLTPASPASLSQSPLPLEYLSQLSELYRRRSRSDSDLSAWPEPPARGSVLRQGRAAAPRPLFIPGKSGSLESDQSSPQDSPLDLSLRSARLGSTTSSGGGSETGAPPRFGAHHPLLRMRSPGLHPPIPIVHGNVASPTTRDSVALRYNLEVCPVVEQMPPGADVAYVCPVCGQMFSLHDRLAKHMASRHKTKPADASSKAYVCETCKRSFARSDMLTRHMRLHTGLKPYTCRVCGQVFSRSDHLSTHQRTHTGEKPYKCPQCPYAACRRDMITRHMRTHSRYELPEGGGGGSVDETGPPRSPRAPPRRANSEEQPPTYLRHLSAAIGGVQAAPPSPSAALQSLSMQSPAPMETGEPPDD